MQLPLRAISTASYSGLRTRLKFWHTMTQGTGRTVTQSLLPHRRVVSHDVKNYIVKQNVGKDSQNCVYFYTSLKSSRYIIIPLFFEAVTFDV